VAKAASFWQAVNYRGSYQIFASDGILFNHESPLRPANFVEKKIASAACRIARGSKEHLYRGDLLIERGWGCTPEYVEAMRLMLQLQEPDKLLMATGTSNKLAEFVDYAFTQLVLEWQDHVVIDPELFRPTDLSSSKGNLEEAEKLFG